MNKLLTVITVLALVGLVFVSGCVTGNASYDPPAGPVGGGCGIGASVTPDTNPCGEETGSSVNL